MFAAATISIARVICDVFLTERIRRRISRGVAIVSPLRAIGYQPSAISKGGDPRLLIADR
jgi:hypothetical protein